MQAKQCLEPSPPDQTTAPPTDLNSDVEEHARYPYERMDSDLKSYIIHSTKNDIMILTCTCMLASMSSARAFNLEGGNGRSLLLLPTPLGHSFCHIFFILIITNPTVFMACVMSELASTLFNLWHALWNSMLCKITYPRKKSM